MHQPTEEGVFSGVARGVPGTEWLTIRINAINNSAAGQMPFYDMAVVSKQLDGRFNVKMTASIITQGQAVAS